MQEPSLNESANIMIIQTHDQIDVNFPVKISVVNVITLYDTCANMSCMSSTCYKKLKNLHLLKMVSSMSVHSATGHMNNMLLSYYREITN